MCVSCCVLLSGGAAEEKRPGETKKRKTAHEDVAKNTLVWTAAFFQICSKIFDFNCSIYVYPRCFSR